MTLGVGPRRPRRRRPAACLKPAGIAPASTHSTGTARVSRTVHQIGRPWAHSKAEIEPRRLVAVGEAEVAGAERQKLAGGDTFGCATGSRLQGTFRAILGPIGIYATRWFERARVRDQKVTGTLSATSAGGGGVGHVVNQQLRARNRAGKRGERRRQLTVSRSR